MEPESRSHSDDAPETSYYESPESDVEQESEKQRFYAPGPIKFVLMHLATFGIYSVYWSYRNWRFIKERDQSGVVPILCALFYPLTFYWFMKSMAPSLNSSLLSNGPFRVVMSIALYLFSASSLLPEPYVLISLLSCLVLLPVVLAMVSTAEQAPSKAIRVPAFHWSNAFAYILGLPLMLLVMISMTGVVPSTAVISGDQMRDADIAYLRQAGILGEDEEIEHFYSTALLSIADDGQFYSSDYVTSYNTDPQTGELYLSYAAYPEIEDIDVNWSDSVMADTIVTIVTSDEGSFEVWLSPEAGGDRVFVDGMMALWRENRDP